MQGGQTVTVTASVEHIPLLRLGRIGDIMSGNII
jgi:hypothetical protein